jgi:hypothetical protein
MPQSIRTPRRGLVPDHRLVDPDHKAVFDQQLQMWHHMVKIQIAIIDNLRFACPYVAHLQYFA